MIRKIADGLFRVWWRPLLLVSLALGGWVYSHFSWPVLALLMMTFVYLLATCIYQFIYSAWWKSLVGMLFGAVAFLITGVLMLNGFLQETIDGDGFANQLSIPNNVRYDSLYTDAFLSGETSMMDSLRSVLHTPPDFQLYESGQPGLFVYDVWLGRIDSGTVYFKAFELSKGIELSSDRLNDASALSVGNYADTVGFFSAQHTFTIYEGDWGKPYGARFELWYKSATDETMQLLRSKNYIIEGWQR